MSRRSSAASREVEVEAEVEVEVEVEVVPAASPPSGGQTKRRKQSRPSRVSAAEPPSPGPTGQPEEVVMAASPPSLMAPLKARSPRKRAPSTANGGMEQGVEEVVVAASPPSLVTPVKSKTSGKRAPSSATSVTCGVCKEKVHAWQFEQHRFEQHLGLARPEGQSQEFSRQEKTRAYNRVIREKAGIACPLCNKVLTSGLGYFHHESQCGKEVEPVKCDYCEAYVKPLSMPRHLADLHREQTGNRKNPNRPDRYRKRRRAAADDSDSEAAESPAAAARQRRWEEEEEKKGPGPRPHSGTLAKWRRRLAEQKPLECPHCPFTAGSLPEALHHHPRCPSHPARARMYCCGSCGLAVRSRELAQRHLLQEHAGQPSAVLQTPRLTAPPPPPPDRGGGRLSADLAGRLAFFTALERQACPQSQARLLSGRQPESRALSRLPVQRRHWWPCSPEEQRAYCPPLRLSPAYKVQTLGSPDDCVTYDRLEQFGWRQLEETGVLLFCGGPAVAAAWCPRPAEQPQLPQYLAVAALPAVSQSFPPTEASSLPCSLQLWSLRPDLSAARMEYAVCVDGGPVWDLAWCPLGSRSKLGQDRLGTLAAACGDGFVRVYVLPRPDPDPDSAQPGRFYIKHPDLRLAVFGQSASPCVRLDWARSDGNRTVSAVYGNGAVAFWDVTSSSPLLTDTDSSGVPVVYQSRLVPVHRGCGTALALSDTSDRFFCSGGRDRTLQIVDLEEPALVPRASNKVRPVPTDICWIPGTKKLAVAYDHSLFTGSPTVLLLDAAAPVQDQPLFTHSASCGSLAVCRATNGLACGSEAGLLALAHWRNMLSHKFRAELRRLLLKVETERLSQTAAPPHGHADTDTDLYMQYWESHGLTIWLAKPHQHTGKIKEAFDDHVSSCGRWVSAYPFVSVNKVAWNDNPDTSTWLAAGLESGFLCVMDVPESALQIVKS